MSTDTKLNPCIINKLTKAQYTAATKETDQFYLCTDTHEAFLGSIQIGWAPVVSTVGSSSVPVYLNSNVLTACTTSSLVDKGMPDYTAGFSINSGYTATQNYIGYAVSDWNGGTRYVRVNDQNVHYYRSGDYGKYVSSIFPVPKGSVVTASSGISTLMLFPCVGG